MINESENEDRSLGNLLRYYTEEFSEADRLLTGPNALEFIRTQDILERYLPPPPAVILDVGGGPGIYTCRLLSMGYEVHLIDPVPLHIEQANKAIAEVSGEKVASATLGSATSLERDDSSSDAVLFMGPLYHLTDKKDREQALGEAHRVLKPGGFFFGIGISRFASLIDGLNRGLLADPQFTDIVSRDLQEGQHRNPTDNPEYWTDAYFHHPEELEEEVLEAGFQVEALIAIEGFGWALNDFDSLWKNEELRKRILEFLRTVETDKSIIGASPHIAVLAYK